MKNKLFPWALSLFLFSGTLSAQERSSEEITTNFNSVSEAAHLSREIISAAGLKANFDIRKANVPNAAAVLYGSKRYILYNPDFIDKLTRATGTKWAAVSVLAHEIGHHLYRQKVNGRIPQMASELEADEFSGYVLQRMGATLNEAQAAMNILASSRATRTHPGRNDRLASIARGFERAGGDISNPASPHLEDMAGNIVRTIPTLIDNRDIMAKIEFNADPGTNYYVTTRFNVVKVTDQKLYMVGKMEKNESTNYPFVMYDASKTPLFVSRTGKIVNRRGAVVGSLIEQE